MVVHKRTGSRSATAAASDTHIHQHTDVHAQQNVGTRTWSGGWDGGGRTSWSRVPSSPSLLSRPTSEGALLSPETSVLSCASSPHVQALSSASSASLSPARTDGIFALLAAAAGNLTYVSHKQSAFCLE
jgi:hypothetical protein